MPRYDFFYERQQLRFIEQVVRAFSGFQYSTGRRNGQAPVLRTVPCQHAQNNRMVASIMRNLSENTINAVPMITVFQTGTTFAKERVQSPTHVSTLQVHERAIANDVYTSEGGNTYSVYRLMPRPIDMAVQVDVWTSNLDQKYQLEEQILTIFTPSINIQNTENPLDWSGLTEMELQDYTRSSRSFPVGTENEIDVMTFTFKIPMWLNPPAVVQQQRIIHQIISNIHDGEIVDGDIDGTRLAQHATTPGNHHIMVDGNVITLLGPKGSETDADGNVYRWSTLFERYEESFGAGTVRLLISLSSDIDDSSRVVGTLTPDPGAPNQMLWQIDLDTLPSNTLAPINAVINPLTHFPGEGLPAAATGQRYLILNEIGPSQAWGNVTARAGDILQYNGTNWTIVFNALSTTDSHYVVNSTTGRQLRFSKHEWTIAVGGQYPAGFWSLRF